VESGVIDGEKLIGKNTQNRELEFYQVWEHNIIDLMKALLKVLYLVFIFGLGWFGLSCLTWTAGK